MPINIFFKFEEKKVLFKHLIVFIFFVCFTLIITYPFIFKASSDLPAAGDPFAVAQVFNWNIKKIISLDLKNFFDNNIFYPHPNTLAYSENFLSQSLLALPWQVLSHNPVLAYNIVILLGFILTAFGAYLLVFYYTRNFLAGLLAGIIFGFAPFKYLHNFSHPQLTAMWLPYLILAWEYYLKKSKVFSGFLIVLFIFLFIGSSLYFSAFLPFLFLIFFLVKFKTSGDSKQKKRVIGALLISLLAALLVILLLIRPYLKLNKEGFYRLPDEIMYYTPGLESYFMSPLNFPSNYDHELMVGPGWALLGTFIVSLIFLFKRRRELKQETKVNLFIFLIIGLVGLIMSLGFFYRWRAGSSGLPTLFYFLYYLFPGYSGIRGLGRFSVFSLFFLALAIGYAFDWYWRHCLQTMNKKIYFFIIFSVISMLFLSEVLISGPISFVSARPIPPVYHWPQAQSGDWAILELPFLNQKGEQQNYLYVYYAIYHEKKLVNGYSSYEPADFTHLWRKLHFFKPKEDYEIIKKYNVKYLIIHYAAYSPEEQARIKALIEKDSNYQALEQFGSDVVYELK